ncbi:unnamed protein product [Linum tenue]|uniref:DYW domain-containing protein n=1 Tax=Linum tenue TaxID=586396 RepID=A0AAV0H5S1_9ROSI|nr:unnamed protein product [Linum tenue]
MVNGFSQNGDNEKALSVFSRMLEENVRPNDFTVVSALSACAKIGAVEAGLRIHKYIKDNRFRLNAAIGTALVDMYAKCGNIESVDGQVHRFVAGDNAHHKDANEIHQKLEEIMSGARKQGYMPGTEWVLHNIEEEEKEDALGSHSEKLALAFALIQTSPKTAPIRIVKNLRICGDCHSLMKYASIMSQREIIVRDIKRFHHFKDGTCSCGDYW